MIEVKSWPIVGWLATKAGTLYISRGGKTAAAKAIADISHVLNQDHNAMVFAEGRVTDGHIKKFHCRLLQSAIDTSSALQPVALYYPSQGNELVNPAVTFYGGITLTQSLLKMMAEKRTEVEVSFLDAFNHGQHSRKELASIAENQIRARLGQ